MMQYKRLYENKEIDHKLVDHFPVKAHFTYLAFVGKLREDQCFTPKVFLL